MPRYYYPYATKDTVEQHKNLTTKFLKDNQYLTGGIRAGNVIWSRRGQETGRIWIVVDLSPNNGPHIKFSYKTRRRGEEEWNDVDYSLPLTSVPCYFGGKRWYFVCTFSKNGKYCGRRVAVLYDTQTYFCCRHCADLSYESCNESNRYRRGYFRIVNQQFKADEYFTKHVKRTHYRGHPTRKYLRYLQMQSSFSERDAELAWVKIENVLGKRSYNE